MTKSHFAMAIILSASAYLWADWEFRDKQDNPISVKAVENKYVMYVVMSSHVCSVYYEEAKTWAKLSEEFKDRLDIYGVVLEKEEYKTPWFKNIKVPFPIYYDEKGTFKNLLQSKYFPMKYIYDSKSNLIYIAYPNKFLNRQEQLFYEVENIFYVLENPPIDEPTKGK